MRSLPGCLLLLVPMALGAQEVVTLSQSLSMGLNASQARAEDSFSRSSTLQTDYRFDVGMPIVAYRLGALNLGGNLDWVRQNNDGQSDSALALSTIGLAGSLFPYQPYHVSFDYTHLTNPDLFSSGKANSDTWGLGLAYHGPIVQSLRMAYRQGTTSGTTRGGFSSFGLADDQHRGNTDLRFQGDWLEANNDGLLWRNTALVASASTTLSKDWYFLNNLHAQSSQGSSQTQFTSNLIGRTGGWTAMTSLNSGYDAFPGQSSRTLGLGQSLAHTWGRLSGFTTLGFATASTAGEAPAPPPAAHLSLGAVYKLTQAWSVLGDVSGGWTGQREALGPATGQAGQPRTLHAGLNWGGELVDQMQQALFYWTNLRFQRRLEEDYPPGYLSPEVTQIVLRRRREQSGTMTFATDIYRSDNDLGHQTWYRVRGGLNLGTGLMVQTMGDLRKDEGFSDSTTQRKEQNLTLYGIQRLGRDSLSFNYGYSQSSQTAQGGADGPPSSTTTTYAVGYNTFLANVPLSTYLTRSIDATGLVTNNFIAFTSAMYGRVQFRITYQHGWRSNGSRGDQISLNLARAFETIALWGQGD